MKHLILLIVLLFSLRSFAHPVIYQGGTALNSANMAEYSNNYLMYSVSNRWAVGADHWRFSKNKKNTEAGLIKFNHLLWRFNGDDSQANIYLHGGVGAVDQEWGKRGTHALYMGGAEVDWETRSLYTAIKRYQFHAPGKLDLSMTQARLGISPFYADFNSLQSWFMLQFMHIDQVVEEVMITPMVRFFYHNVLWEMGSSTRGDWMLNLMVHF
jgi:hypothetical protein